MNIKEDLTPINYTPDGIKEYRGIVMHSMWGTYAGSIAWFKNPSAGASAHYCISAEGEITRCVLEKDMAWHAGIIDDVAPTWVLPNPNWYCIGIELEDKKDSNWMYPEAERKAAAELVADIMKRRNITKDHVVTHKSLNPSRRSDPVGNFSFDWLFANVSWEPTPSPAGTITQEQYITDSYLALKGTISEDEKRWRLEQNKNLKDLLTDLLASDSGVFAKWFQPKLDAQKTELDNVNNLALSERDKNWQNILASAKQALTDEQNKNIDEILAEKTFSELFSLAFKKLWIYRKSQSSG